MCWRIELQTKVPEDYVAKGEKALVGAFSVNKNHSVDLHLKLWRTRCQPCRQVSLAGEPLGRPQCEHHHNHILLLWRDFGSQQVCRQRCSLHGPQLD